MTNINFSKRIFTSVILLFILFICLFLSEFLWLYLLTAASFIAYFEFNNLIKKITVFKKQKKNLFNLLSCIYLIFFTFTGYNLLSLSPLVLFFALLICILSDTGGYLIGKLIGGKKLTKTFRRKQLHYFDFHQLHLENVSK